MQYKRYQRMVLEMSASLPRTETDWNQMLLLQSDFFKLTGGCELNGNDLMGGQDYAGEV
jgi:hypothetical protein